MPPRTAHPIEDYGIIGDLHTVALISTDASIDFLCLPDFDSPTIFAALIDSDKGGHFSVVPLLERSRRKQMYLPETNILTTRYLSENGVAEIVDYMPIDSSGDRHRVIRTVRAVKGQIAFELECCPRFDYGRKTHSANQIEERVIEFVTEVGGLPPVRLIASTRLQVRGVDVKARFTLGAGEEASFVLECGISDEPTTAADEETVSKAFAETSDFWRAWAGLSTYTGRWRETVSRSALLLKLLTSRKHGSIIAAPTFGLPERPGGARNWDYRYTWMRDAAFTVYAFMRLGYTEEARRFMLWLKDRVALKKAEGPLQVMYRANGDQNLDEIPLEHLAGYQDSRPVRIGNAASKQLQLDIYGELMDAIYLATKYGDALSYDAWKNICGLVDWIAQNWTCPDEGIWEVRAGRKQFLHSRIMCWVAVDRALRLSEKRSLPAPFHDWQVLRTAIYESVFDQFWNHDLQSFVAYVGADFVDASALLMPLVRFISPIDPRWLGTMKKIESDLTEDALVYRYNSKDTGIDGLEGTEGTFTACSFWYIECLARSHQLDKARLLFEKMISYSNHLGLYSEELGPSGEHLGNFPQALTHLALISAASYLDRALSGNHHDEWR
ncbi:MAG: glycoside hydrolase family 15 protein [Acidobacteriota bacterium]|nr:glycoside hydrolase family 15 protein [Acidobacteriota bacterium]